MATFVRVMVLLWADILVLYTMFVMQTYLTNVWKLSFTHAAGILNIWNGVTMVLPIGFLYLVDAFLGKYIMLLLSSIAFSVGMGFLSMSTPPVLASYTGTCKDYEPKCLGDTQKALFYTALALLAVGISGHLVSLKPFLDEQMKKPDDGDGNKVFFQILGLFMVAIMPIVGAISLPYIKPWSIRFGIPAICTTFATLLFLSGSCSYIIFGPDGSPLTNVCRVFVASTSKISKPFPLDARELYTNDGTELRSFSRTRLLRRLEKAAIILPDKRLEEQENNRWRLCTVTEVEEAKIVVRMVPMWMTFIVCGIVSSIGNTYFLEQANHMDRKLGKWTIPLPMLLLLFNYAKKLFAKSYTCLESCFCKRYAPPVGIAVAMVFSVLCCITSARIEIRRLKVIRRHDLIDKPEDDIPMSIFWLLFQFFLLAGLDSFFEKSSVAFFEDQAPESMRNYLQYSSKGVSGLGFMGSVLSVYVVGKISEKGGRPNWFQYTLNKSRLDRYYWVLAALSSVNLVVYIFIAYIYKYKEPGPVQRQGDENGPLNGQPEPGLEPEPEPEQGESGQPEDGDGAQ